MAAQVEAMRDVFPDGEDAQIDLLLPPQLRARLARMGGTTEGEVAERAGMFARQMAPLLRAYYQADPIDRVAGLYTDDEQAFLRNMCVRFSRVKTGFAYFGMIRSAARPFKAVELLSMQPRTGWQRIGVPEGFVQSVDDHHRSGEILAHILFGDDPELELISSTFRYHDAGESLIGDFTPHCPISKDEKIRLEALAVRLITADRSRGHPMAQTIYQSFAAYEGFIPLPEGVREKVRDIDLLEMTLESAMIRSEAPMDARAAIDRGLAEFDAYVTGQLKHSRARSFCAGLLDPALRHAHPVKVWGHAMQGMFAADPDYAALCAGKDWSESVRAALGAARRFRIS